MEPSKAQDAKAEQTFCPFLRPAQADWIYPVEGYCEGLPRGLLMIPTAHEYQTLCSTAGHTACPIYRAQQGDDGLEAWLRARYQAGGLWPA